MAGEIAVAIAGNVDLIGDRIDRYGVGKTSADGDIGGGQGGAVDRRHGGRAGTVGIVAALVGDIDLVGSRIDVHGVGIISHIDRLGVVGHSIDYGHRAGNVGRTADGTVAASVSNVDLVSYRVDHWGGRGKSDGNRSRDGIARAVDHRHRPAATEIVATLVGDVDLVGHRVHYYAVGTTASGDGGNDGVAHAINHRYRSGAAAGGIVAVLVGDVDPVGHRIDRHPVGEISHIDGQRVVGRPVNDGQDPARVAVGIVPAPICHVDGVGYGVDGSAQRPFAYG